MEPYFENGSGLTLLKIGEKDFILRTTVGTGIQLKLKTKSVSFFSEKSSENIFYDFYHSRIRIANIGTGTA